MTERLTGISGSMFSGKTEEMLRLVSRAEIAGAKVQVFKPAIDNRWGKLDTVRSHSGAEHPATPVNSAVEILDALEEETDMVAIDEVQFLGPNIVPVIQTLLEKDIEVVFAGLPLDFRGESFGQMPRLLVIADEIRHLTAVCTYSENGEICGKDATRTQRFVNGRPAHYTDPVIQVGAEESYAARCGGHHEVPGKPEPQIVYQAPKK